MPCCSATFSITITWPVPGCHRNMHPELLAREVVILWKGISYWLPALACRRSSCGDIWKLGVYIWCYSQGVYIWCYSPWGPSEFFYLHLWFLCTFLLPITKTTLTTLMNSINIKQIYSRSNWKCYYLFQVALNSLVFLCYRHYKMKQKIWNQPEKWKM